MNLHATHLRILFFESLYWLLIGCCAGWALIGWASLETPLLAFGAIGLALFIYAGILEPRWLTLKTYAVRLAPDPLRRIRIVFLSDLHGGAYKGRCFYERVVRAANALEPDCVIIGGDLVEERAHGLRDVEALAGLRAPYGVYFILGNHDFEDDPGYVRRTLVKWGLEDITNRRIVLPLGGGCELVGLDDAWRGAPAAHLIHLPKTLPRILVMHEPDGLLDVDKGEADLVLTGHTHGGQVRLPFFGALASLPQRLPRSFDRGRLAWKEIPVIISQGLGEASTRLRFFCPPQIVVVDAEV